MNVSIIIPSHNAAGTIAKTLESLLVQTFLDWEAIVVDDGSTDRTLAIASSFAERDARIRTESQPQRGVSQARNKGMSLARFDWLLFLDADDWLFPEHLRRTTDVLISTPGTDAVHCGWTRSTPDGTLFGNWYGPESNDLFPEFARTNVFAVPCACVVRRFHVETVGCFDTSFRTCEDWDLWQRIARAGAQFAAIPEVLVCYRLRPDSLSVDGYLIFSDGIRVLTQGHSFDPRVPNPYPSHANGLPVEQLPSAKLRWTCWPAGLVIGRGKDARPLLNPLREDHDPNLDPNFVAHVIFEAVIVSACQTSVTWIELWANLEQRIDEFLLALEKQSQAPGLARRTHMILEDLTLESSKAQQPRNVRATEGSG